jgi:hypothetical protein
MALDFNVNNRLPPKTPEEISEALKLQAKNIYSNMVNVFNRGSKIFWDNPNATPEQIAVSLGPDAKQLFQLHYQLGQLISSVNPADIAAGASVIGQFTMNEDGTVTVIDNNSSPSS